MKTPFLPRFGATAALLLLLAVCPDLAAQNGLQMPFAQVLPSPHDGSEDASHLKSYTFAQRTEFAVAVRNIAAKLDAQIAAFGTAPTDGTTETPDRARAREELQAARTELEERLGRIDRAIPENWESVRDDVLSALAQVQSAYDRATQT